MGHPDRKMVLAAGRNVADERLPGTVYLDPGPCLLYSGKLRRIFLVRCEGLAEGIFSGPDIGNQYSCMCIAVLSIYITDIRNGISAECTGCLDAQQGKASALAGLCGFPDFGAWAVSVQHRLCLRARVDLCDPDAAG